MLWIDHVILGCTDLDAAAERLLERHGLDSAPGGVHPTWGTGNRIVPLGSSYIELLGVVDPEAAAKSFLGRELMQKVNQSDRLIGWCVATDRLYEICARLGLDLQTGSRLRPDGRILQWRSCGLERAMGSNGLLPFFISWEVRAEEHPGRDPADHRIHPNGIAWVQVQGEPTAVDRWLGEDRSDLPLRVVSGNAGIQAVGIATDEGEIVLK